MFSYYCTYVLFICIVSSQVNLSLENGELITDLDEAMEFLAGYGERAKVVYYASSLTSWKYNTNITDYNQQKDLEASLDTAAFGKEAYENATRFNETGFPEDIRRQFKKLKDIGTAALEPSKVKKARYLQFEPWLFYVYFCCQTHLLILCAQNHGLT